MRFSPELIERVREATDIVAVVGEHVQLKKAGRTHRARCPFHQEKTPSFHVNPDLNIYKCFGCGEGGDVFRFLMEFEKLTFPEAMEMLAGRAGIALPKSHWQTQDESVFPALEAAVNLYRKELNGPAGKPARDYFAARGVTAASCERFQLGWARPGWSNCLDRLRPQFNEALLERAGLAIPNDRGGHYDRFRDRIMIPIRSPLGRAIGFGARTIGNDEPKYLNSPETEVFHKSKVLFGLHEARDAIRTADEVIVVEGYLDVIALAQNDIQHAVASCGTAFTEDQGKVLRRYAQRVVLLFDGDKAGLRAAWKSAAVFLAQGLEVRIVALPEGHDPDTYVREHGVEAMRAMLAGAPGVVAFAQDALLDTLENREDLLKAFVYLATRIEDPIRRRVLLQEAAERFRFDENTLAAEVAKARGERPRPRAATPASRGHRDQLGRSYLAALIASKDPTEKRILPAEIYKEEELRRLHERLVALREAGVVSPLQQLLDDDSTRSLVSELLTEELEHEGLDEVFPRIRLREQALRGERLREAIREAEAHGDAETVDRLLRELQALKTPAPETSR